MIVVDTSALIAIVKDEPKALACIEAIDKAGRVLISAGGKNVWTTMSDFLDKLDLEVIEVDAHTAKSVGTVYSVWGKGVHPASLNFGDCFAYALAVQYQCPLLYVGNDFAQTDIVSAI